MALWQRRFEGADLSACAGCWVGRRCDSGDPFVAIEGIILRDPFSASVTEAEVLAQPTVHYLGLLSDTYATVRRYARRVGT